MSDFDKEALAVACEVIIAAIERFPRTPTPEMVGAGTAAYARSPYLEAQRIIDIWQAMHDEATAKGRAG